MKREEACNVVEALYGSWYAALVRYGAYLCGSWEAAEDAVQESFMSLYLEYRKSTAIRNPKGYTLRAVRNQISMRQRNIRSHAEVGMDMEDLDTFQAPQSWPAGNLETSEQIDRFLSVLTPREAEVVLLRLEGLKYNEIARELGIGNASVSTLLSRAMKKIECLSLAGTQPGKTVEWNHHAPKTLQ